jgi:hypothetical protein
MTNQKSKGKCNSKGRSRFPAGMTSQKNKGKYKSNSKSRFPAGMTKRTATVKAVMQGVSK